MPKKSKKKEKSGPGPEEPSHVEENAEPSPSSEKHTLPEIIPEGDVEAVFDLDISPDLDEYETLPGEEDGLSISDILADATEAKTPKAKAEKKKEEKLGKPIPTKDMMKAVLKVIKAVREESQGRTMTIDEKIDMASDLLDDTLRLEFKTYSLEVPPWASLLIVGLLLGILFIPSASKQSLGAFAELLGGLND